MEPVILIQNRVDYNISINSRMVGKVDENLLLKENVYTD